MTIQLLDKTNRNHTFSWLKPALYSLLIGLILFAILSISYFFWSVAESIFAFLALTIGALFAWIYFSPKMYNYRYVFPGLLALVVIIIIPIGFTIHMSLSNYSESNMLRYGDAKEILMSQTYIADDGIRLKVNGWQDEDNIHLYLENTNNEKWYTPEITLPASIELNRVISVKEISSPATDKFNRKFIFSSREELSKLSLVFEGDITLSKDSLKTFSERKPRYIETDNNLFLDQQTGDVIQAVLSDGMFMVAESEDESRIGGFITPTFLRSSSLKNYAQLLSDKDQIKSFNTVFTWSIFVATFTVATTFLISLIAASLLNWVAIAEREAYKTLIVACYAFPSFAIISSFWVLFQTEQVPWGDVVPMGPINATLNSLFSIKPDWMFDPVLSRVKFLIVQFWLFMPFMFIMCVGVIQSIPKSMYEAATLEGAGVRQQFLRITLPLTFIPLAPVLIIAFATAFNDLTLVSRLTASEPLIPGSVPVAGYTDLLVSFANTQAFGAPYARSFSGNYSLASTLFTIIFIIVGIISMLYLRLIKLKPTGRES